MVVKILNLAKWGPITVLWNLNVNVSYYKSAKNYKNDWKLMRKIGLLI
jgi:hypothetical protein